MFLKLENINYIINRLEESDKAISGATARDQLMWGQTTMFANLGIANKELMKKGMELYAQTMATFKTDMMSLISDYQRGSLDYAGAVAKFKSVTSGHYQTLFKAGAVAMGNPYYDDPAIGLTKRDLSFIQKARNFEGKFLRKFLLDIKNPDFKPRYDFQTRAGFYADSGKAQFFNGMVNGAGDNVEIHWVMSEAVEEHCDICPILASKVYTWKTLPTTPRAGDTPCLFNCKCELEIVPKQASAPTGQSFNPYTPGSGTPKAMEVPGRWAQVTRGGETMVGQLSKDIEDLYQQMYKARQMITVTHGTPEAKEWIALRRDLNAQIIQKAGSAKVRVTPTVSVFQLQKALETAVGKSTGNLLSLGNLENEMEVVLLRGNVWTVGMIKLQGAKATVVTAKGTSFVVDNRIDILYKVRGRLDPNEGEQAILTRMTKGTGLTDAKPVGDEALTIQKFLNKQKAFEKPVYRVIWLETEADATKFFERYLDPNGPKEPISIPALSSWSVDPTRVYAYGKGGYTTVRFSMTGTSQGQKKFVDVSRWSVYPQEQEVRNLSSFSVPIVKSSYNPALGWQIDLGV